MAVQANRMMLAEMAEVPVKLLPEPEFNLLVKQKRTSSLLWSSSSVAMIVMRRSPPAP